MVKTTYKIKGLWLLFLFMMPFFLAHCASLRSVSISSLPAKRNRIIIAQTSQLQFFSISFDNSYVDQLLQKLIDQCPNGSVEGILTKEEKLYYIYYVLEETRVTAKGYCNARL